ncbi:zinc finger protein 99-like isoform X1 [Leguminivora glycinivorella]|uniref:zinc finger protein 99-like isoform X1 n=1 Tax=Leguminivora glycinivorella TaxID=1035111 RepID=UPI002010A804|nr:zinc finger protein 99-like isoform X1 [Leguminivora glycinivorella]
MNCVKRECDDLICRGCLSTDRRLSPLSNYDLFLSFLAEKQRTEVLSKPYILICWECNTVLRRFQLFQCQVRRAHTVLEESLTLPTKNTLSCLSIYIKDKYDACFENSQILDLEIPSIESIKNELPRNAETDDHVKVEAINNSDLNVPPKKRKLKNKIEKKKKEALVTNLKEKSKKKTKKDKNKLEIGVFNVNENIEVEVKSERVSDVEDNQDTFDDDHVTNDSDYSYKDGKHKKEYKKRILTYKRTIIQYGEDVSEYFTEVEMSDQMRSVLEKQAELVDDSKPYRCEFCGISFRTKKPLTRHVNHSHKKEMHKEHIKKEPSALYRCRYCNRMLRKEHTHSHLLESHRRKYQCAGCRWSRAFFWSKADHSHHWKTVHATLVCDICGKTRRNTRDMERHMRASHLPIKCPQCPRTYSKWKYYRQHQKMAHPVLALEPPESRYCVECDMQCPSIMAYKMHVMNQHRSTPKKRWPCPACGKTLNNKDTMKKHYALFHSDKTSYQCVHCGKYLSSKCSLQHHLNSHLNIKLPKDKLCSICGRGFSTKRMLRFHVYTHTGERPYACAHCPAAFTQPNPLRVHQRRLHPHLPPTPARPTPHKE